MVYVVNQQIKQRLLLKEMVCVHYIAPSLSKYGIEIVLKSGQNRRKQFFFPYFTKGNSDALQSYLNDVMHT